MMRDRPSWILKYAQNALFHKGEPSCCNNQNDMQSVVPVSPDISFGGLYYNRGSYNPPDTFSDVDDFPAAIASSFVGSPKIYPGRQADGRIRGLPRIQSA